MARKLYGKHAVNIDVNQSIDRYLRGRPYNTNIEKPLFSVGMQPRLSKTRAFGDIQFTSF